MILLTLSGHETRPTEKNKSLGVNCSDWESVVNKYGARVFMMGDRSLRIPASVQELEATTCPRLYEASDRLKDVIRSCFKPFTRTMAGLLVRGTRASIKKRCSDPAERAVVVQHLSCVQHQQDLDQFHDVVDSFTRKLVYIRDHVKDSQKLDLTCCHYMDVRRGIVAVARKFCPAPAVQYTATMMDDMMREAIELACSSYQRDSDKCLLLMKQTPIRLKARDAKHREGTFLLPLISVLSSVADHDSSLN